MGSRLERTYLNACTLCHVMEVLVLYDIWVNFTHVEGPVNSEKGV